MNNQPQGTRQPAPVAAAREMVSSHLAGRHAGRAPPQTNSGPRHAILSRAPPAPTPDTSAVAPHRDQGTCAGSQAQVCVPAKGHVGPCTNPQCQHCGTVIIPLPKARYPILETPSITVNEWSVYTHKGPILASDELDALAPRFPFPLPEMVFGHSHMRLVHDPSGALVVFSTIDALDTVGHEAGFKVAAHTLWMSTRKNANHGMEAVEPYDWTYSTNYSGTVSGFTARAGPPIPMEKLVRPDPILFFDEAVLFEDELGDNGILVLLAKIRVMPSCLLVLCRFLMRIDDVAFRVRDTRIYIDLDSGQVIREYKEQQADYAAMLARARGLDPKKLLRDANWVAQNAPVVSKKTEELLLETAQVKE